MNESDSTRDNVPEIGPTSDASSPQTPESIGRYRIEKVLGQGGFGVVYLAVDDQLQRFVAIKVPHRKLVDRVENADAYLNEARNVANLDHPNIVPVYDVGSDAAYPCYVVSKYVDSKDLATQLKQRRLSLEETVELIATVAEALHHAHKQGLVHRDIKPRNIVLGKNGKPYLADFGLALREQDVGKGPRYTGTPAYMSPEQARGEGHRVDGRSDIFSLGVVLYEMLVGRAPFRGETAEDLADQITSFEPRPPRQYDDSIPLELERISLKALAKRAAERYTTAKDFAADLRLFQAQQFGATPTSAPGARSSVSATPVLQQPTSTMTGSSGGNIHTPASAVQTPIMIVPKGLRSFDANDADFFLELLPGPRDRAGLPESIRFWKARVEETDADQTFSVGLVYGPSGSGKSSLVKAGLLPHLSNDVIAIYVEATAGETESRLLNRLRKRFPTTAEGIDLKETLAALRRGQGLGDGKKILIIIDQFEQWLHAKKEAADYDLVQALRQCDGAHVQCLLLMRDDFWMAITRFMRTLEIQLWQGQNCAAVDRFDRDHAKKVLAAFGRAYARIPERQSDMSEDQRAFLDQAVSGLAQEDKVVCVRLALFAEMMKSKPWTTATLKDVGGTEGVGVAFLEETFSSQHHRALQKPAQAVLRALLPARGTDIKGHMRSSAELMAAAGYADHTREFESLLQVLDRELRLITPTDPEGIDSESASVTAPLAGRRYYQLTHDYLVPALRDWLARKQKETRRGRAELVLADRASVWKARPENQQLPSLAQTCQIWWWTSAQDYSDSQRKMMQHAWRYHALRGCAVATFLVLAIVVGLVVRGRIIEQGKAAHAADLVQALLNADIAKTPGIIEEMGDYRPWLDSSLRDAGNQAAAAKDARKQLHVSLALLPVDADQVNYLHQRLLDADVHELQVIRDALLPHKTPLLQKLWTTVETPEKGKESQRLRAAAALAKYDAENPRWTNASALVANDLVQENAVFLGQWSSAFQPVKDHLQNPLAVIFRDAHPDRISERKLATSLLADYAADQPGVLVTLLLDADEKQFHVFFPRVREFQTRSLPLLLAEIDRQPTIGSEQVVLAKDGAITDDDAQVKVRGVVLAAKRYTLSLQREKTYRFTIDGKGFDAIVSLQDEMGTDVPFDDEETPDPSGHSYSPTSDGMINVLVAALKGGGGYALKIVETDHADDAREKLAKRQANAGAALLRMKRAEKIWSLLKHAPDPRLRSYLINRLHPLGADAGPLFAQLETEPDLSARRALILALGAFPVQDVTPEQRRALLERIQESYRRDPDPGIHAASEWFLRQWKHDALIQTTNDAWAKNRKEREQRLATIRQTLATHKAKAPPQWYVDGHAHTMVVLAGPIEFMMGSPTTERERGAPEMQHKQRIGRTFAIASKAVTMEQFRRFDAEHPAGKATRPGAPALAISWNSAARYCNWLSKREGILEEEWCYEIQNDVIKLRPNYLQRAGYRLPTEAEMEFAARAGAATARFFGQTDELLPKYAWYVKNSHDQPWPVGRLKPNDFGLFDVHGNVFNWCQERFLTYRRGNGNDAIDDVEDELAIGPTDRRVLRGGSYGTPASVLRSAHRDLDVPSYENFDVGFRVARTFAHPE